MHVHVNGTCPSAVQIHIAVYRHAAMLWSVATFGPLTRFFRIQYRLLLGLGLWGLYVIQFGVIIKCMGGMPLGEVSALPPAFTARLMQAGTGHVHLHGCLTSILLHACSESSAPHRQHVVIQLGR